MLPQFLRGGRTMCDCGERKAIFVCMNEDCYLNKRENLYCEECDEKHQHKSIFISKQIALSKEKWSEIKQTSEMLNENAEKIFKPLEPLI